VVLPFKNAGFGEFQTYLQAGRSDEFLKKVAQNVAQPIFLSKLIAVTVGNSSPSICATSVIFKRQPKVNNRPLGQNWPNLVTLPTRELQRSGLV
jgi:hypothetical protein